jgi:hypothetical protein
MFEALMKTTRLIFSHCAVAALALAVACSGGGGSSGGNSVVSTGGFSAYLADSTVANANCVAIDATQNQLLITTGSGGGGHMSFTVTPAPTVNDWVLLECTGGSYRDPATGTTIVLSAGTSLQEAYFKYTDDNPALVVVTSISSVAALRVYGTGVPSDYPVQLRQVAILLGLGNNDISSVQPTDVTTTAADASLAGQYGIAVAMLSEMMKDKPGTYSNPDTLTSALIASMLGGLVDSSTKADMQAALANYSASPQNTLVPRALLSASSPFAMNLAAGNAMGTLTTQSNTLSNGAAHANGSALAYGMPITATGGTPPYHYQFDTFANGTPPLGMSVNLVTGELTGKPTVPGTYTFGVCATDLVGASSCSQVTITITPAPASSGGGGTGGTIVGTWDVAPSQQGCTGSPAQYTFGTSGSFTYLLPVQTCTSAGSPPSQSQVCNASGTYTTSGTNLSVNIAQQDQACGGLTTPYDVSFSISGSTMTFGDGTVLTKQ